MTKEEAIKILKAMNMMMHSPDGTPISDGCEALDLAISALAEASADRPTMIPIELKKRYPNSKDEDITDAFMRGFLHGKSEELPSAGGWIPCDERLPEEMEWAGTKRFGTTISEIVYVTFETPDGYRFTEHLRFQNGQLSVRTQKYIDAIGEGIRAIAWMPLPEPWKGENK